MAEEEDTNCLQLRKKEFESRKVRPSSQLKKALGEEDTNGSSKMCLEASSRLSFEGNSTVEM